MQSIHVISIYMLPNTCTCSSERLQTCQSLVFRLHCIKSKFGLFDIISVLLSPKSSDIFHNWLNKYMYDYDVRLFVWVCVILLIIFHCSNWQKILRVSDVYLAEGLHLHTSQGCFCHRNFFRILDQTCCRGTPLHRAEDSGVLSFVTGCPCGVLCRGLTTCPVYVGPFVGKTWDVLKPPKAFQIRLIARKCD